MKLNFNTVLVDHEGKAITDSIAAQSNGGVTKDLTLGNAAIYALNSTFQDEQSLDSNEKFNRGRLAYDIYKTPELDLKAEDIAIVKKVIGKLFSPLVVFQAFNILDGK